MTYVVTFVPRCSDAQHYLNDIAVLIVKGDSKASVIKKLLDLENDCFINFATSFIACRSNIGAPYHDDKRSNEILAKLASEFDELDIADKDNESKETLDYIHRNTEDLVYLIELYANYECNYIDITPIENHMLLK